ncbi:MAG: hypothetical protein WCY93_09220 [Anaerolineaceae bacterium]
MYQIAIGNLSLSPAFTVIHGAGIAAPAFKATCFFNFTSGPFVSEHLEIELKGTSDQIESFIAVLINYFHLGSLTVEGSLNAPLALRFQRQADGPYSYAFLLSPSLAANPGSYLRQSQGSKLITIHYTRPNYFQGPKTPLPVSGLADPEPFTEDYPIYNHTYPPDSFDSTVSVNPAHFSTSLPAPLRLELKPISAAFNLNSLFIGLHHHKTDVGLSPFFFHHDTITGGAVLAEPSAIAGNYRSITFTSPTWETCFSTTLTSDVLTKLSAFPYRPFLRLFAPHAYTDLFFKVTVIHGISTIHTTEAVYSPPGYGYVLLPSLNLPPGPLFKEAPPASLTFAIQAFRESGAATTITTDYLTLFPMSPGAIFYAFYPVKALFIDDSAFSRHGFRESLLTGESVSHSRIGPPLVIHPQHFNRLFFAFSNNADLMPPLALSQLTAFYYPRYALL